MVSRSPAAAALDDALSEAERSPAEEENLLAPHLFTSSLTRRAPKRSAMAGDLFAHAHAGALEAL